MFRHFHFAFASLLILLNLQKGYSQCAIDVNAGDDIYLCSPPTPTQLNGSIGGDFLSFAWTPTTGMTGSNTLSPTVTVTQTTKYILSASAADLSNNLVDNGDFEGGNTGFTSDYVYSPGDLFPEGTYDVLDNPNDDHTGFSACDDHTTGAGNMMVVNGAGVPNQNVWCQTVAVNPNSQYVLSAWVTSVVAGSPALLQFSINGGTVGPIFNAPGTVCNWQNYFQVWNSGASTSATICIVNQNTTLGGNDFALDDIVFAPVCVERDTVQVVVVNVTATAVPSVVTIPCDGAGATLSGVGSSTGPNISYLWETTGGNIVSGETTLNPVVNAPGAYTLTVSYTAPDGTVCQKTATVNVVLSPNPLVAWINPPTPLGCGSSTTTLVGNTNQGAFAAFSWTTTDGNIVSGENLKNCVVNKEGAYLLTVTNTNTGCTATAEVQVISITTPPIANATASDTLTCFQDTITLSSTGSTTGNNIAYAWTTTNGHFISGQNTPTALVDSAGIYILSVTNTTSNCTARDTVRVIGNTVKPYMFLPPQQQITCSSDTIVMIVYLYPPPFVLINWTASDGGHIVSGQYTPNPHVDSMGMYHVTIQDPINGCISTGAVFVTSNMNYPAANILPPGGITCQSPTISLSGSGSSTGPQFGYSWTASNGGNIVSGETTLDPIVNSSGDYTLTVLDSVNGCFTLAQTSVVADTNVVTVIANATDTLDCVVHSFQLNADGSSTGPGITYLWTTADGHIVDGEDSANPTIDLPGAYQLLLTNTANGCAGIDLAVVVENTAAPQIGIDPPAELTCANPSIVLHAHNGSTGASFSYQWSTSGAGHLVQDDQTLSPMVDGPGVYTLLATNLANGCTSTADVSVLLANGVPSAQVAAPNPLSCAFKTQLLDGSASSSGTNYTYQWTAINGGALSGNTNNVTATATTPGDYVLAVTNTANGCIAFDTIALTQNVTPPPADAGAPDTLTCAAPTAVLEANATNPSTALQYHWDTGTGAISGSADLAQISAIAPGMYLVTVTDPANGCTAIDSVAVAENKAAPQLQSTPPLTLTCSLTSQNLDVHNLSVPGNFTYNWTSSNGGNIVSGAGNLNPVVDTQGAYFLVAVNLANGCSSTMTLQVQENITPPNIQVSAPPAVTCANLTQTINAQNLSLPGTFTYNWTATNGGVIQSGASTLSLTVSAGGDFNLQTVDQGNGCSSIVQVHVDQDKTLPTANAGADATLTCNLNSLTLSGMGAGGATLSYKWTASNGGHLSNGDTTPSPVIDAPGTYTLLVTNTTNGCTATDIVEIFNDAGAPVANAGAAGPLTCQITQLTLNGTGSVGGNFSYQWTASNGGNIFNNGNTLTPTVDKPGAYTLVVTNNANGCTRSSSLTLLQDTIAPQLAIAPPGRITCTVGSVTLSGANNSGAATYSWQTANGHIASGNTGLNPVVDKPGVYILTATLQSNGCSATAVATVAIDTISPQFSIQPPQQLTCAQTSIVLTGAVVQPPTGGFTAAWTTATGHISAGQNSLAATVDKPGTYILTITNTQNGCDAGIAVPVFQNIIPPVATVGTPPVITCAAQQVALSGAGSSTGNNFTYNWSAGGGGQIASGGNTLNPQAGSAGLYTLQVTNTSNGCTATATATVTSNTTPPVSAVAVPQPITCVQKTVTLNAAGSSNGAGFNINWTTTGGSISSGQNTLNPVVNAPGTYTLTIQNTQNGCTSSAQATVSQNTTPPGAEAGPGAELHCNHPSADLNGGANGGAALTYAWATSNGHIQSGQNAATCTADAPGLYRLVVTDPANGCTSSDSTLVTSVPLPAFNPLLEQPDCHTRNGLLDFGAVTGGRAPFQYSTDGGQNFDTQSIADLAPGVYAVVVRDDLGCTAEKSVTILEPFIPTLSIASVDVLEVGDSILLEPTTDIPTLKIASWAWSPADGLSCTDCKNPWAKPFKSTEYLLVVSDNNGCEAEAKVRILVNRNRAVYAPNVFSPNDDGLNDYFTIYGKGVKEIRSLQVYDRWGSQIFLGEKLAPGDDSAGWDGYYRGTLMDPAVFVWWARVEFVDGEVQVFYGDVTLVR